LTGLDGVHGVFARLETPIDFEATDRKPVDLVFALFAPEGAGVAHLKALALVSRTLRESALRAKLRSNDDPSVLYTILTESPASAAA
jgi:PTS system nitrogen regulatory IIA component